MKRMVHLLAMALALSFGSGCAAGGNGSSSAGFRGPEFIDCMAGEGERLARQVEPASDIKEYRKESYFSLEDDHADIRWYNGGLLNGDEKARLVGCIPNITFNQDTVFPEDLLADFPAGAILENGKPPGLSVESLHAQGITGKGVGIAVIDQVLYTGHPEYAAKLALYEEMHVKPNAEGSMHGAALASIAVGESCGVAPEAKLYYWGFENVKTWNIKKNGGKDAGGYEIAWEEYARVIDRVLEVNRELPEDGKIRVIAIARGYQFTGNQAEDAELQAMLDAIGRASRDGIFVVSTSTELNYPFFADYPTDAPFAGLGKTDPMGDPDSVDNYTLGAWQWETPKAYERSLLVPMDGRTAADMSGDTYAYYADGGWSWVVPYVAGLYALCAQVKPDITPEEFYRAAMETSTPITRSQNADGKAYSFHVINPPALIKVFQAKA